MNIIITASVLPLFQAIATLLCEQNYYEPANLCYSMTESFPNKVDMQMLDINAGEYLDAHWLDPNTMISIVRDQNGCYMWLDDQWNSTTTCT